MPKLKVFRTTIGFHDAYVATPSRAAALRAWGATTDLFAMGAAEEVTEADLIARPLADPGNIIKQSRGTPAEHLAASQSSLAKGHSGLKKVEKRAAPKPMPSRAKLDAADKRLADAEIKFERAKRDLEDEAARLAARRRAIEHEHQARISGLTDERDRENETYHMAVDRWRVESN